MVKTAYAQWKIAKLGEKQHQMATILASGRKSVPLNSVISDNSNTALILILLYFYFCRAEVIEVFEEDGGQLPVTSSTLQQQNIDTMGSFITQLGQRSHGGSDALRGCCRSTVRRTGGLGLGIQHAGCDANWRQPAWCWKTAFTSIAPTLPVRTWHRPVQPHWIRPVRVTPVWNISYHEHLVGKCHNNRPDLHDKFRTRKIAMPTCIPCSVGNLHKYSL